MPHIPFMCIVVCVVISWTDFSIKACSASGFGGKEESKREILGSVVLCICLNVCMRARSLVECCKVTWESCSSPWNMYG